MGEVKDFAALTVAFRASGAVLACLCSSDKIYAEQAFAAPSDFAASKIAVFIDFDNIEIGVKSTLHREFDVAEMSLSSYTLSLFRNPAPFIAIPVYPSRMFRHSSVYVNASSGIRDASDLVGRRELRATCRAARGSAGRPLAPGRFSRRRSGGASGGTPGRHRW